MAEEGEKSKRIVPYDPHQLKADIEEKVLDEDTYVKGLEKIITRDFFPDLERLEAHSEYLDALEKKDYSRIRELHNKYSVLRQRDSDTPKSVNVFDTPFLYGGSEPSSSRSKRSKLPTHNPESKDPTDRSLDTFLATHTSEDNAAFSEILASVEEKRKERMAWCYTAEKAADSSQTAALPAAGAPLALESSAPESWPGYRVHNSVLFVPPGAPLSAAEKAQRRADRAARRIVHANTHLPGLVAGEADGERARIRAAIDAASAHRHQAAQQQGRVGPDGKELFPVGASPNVRGFSFVPSTPSPAVPDSPLMTWGAVEGTPCALDDRAATPLPGAGFRIPACPRRDRLALELAEEAHRKHRAEKEKAIKRLKGRLNSPALSCGSSSSRTGRLASMSPAALRLSAKIARPVSSLRITPMAVKRRRSPPPVAAKSPASACSGRDLTAGLLQLTDAKRK